MKLIVIYSEYILKKIFKSLLPYSKESKYRDRECSLGSRLKALRSTFSTTWFNSGMVLHTCNPKLGRWRQQ